MAIVDSTHKQCSRKENCVNPLGSWLPKSDEYFGWAKKHGRHYLEAQCKVCKNQYNKEYHTKNRQRVLERQHEYYRDNQTEMIEKSRGWRELNPVKVKSQQQRYYGENAEFLRISARIFDANKRSLAHGCAGTHTVEQFVDLYEQQERRCGYCGIPIYLDVDRDVHEDHMNPIGRGGSNSIDNVVLCCSNCNHSKHAKTVIEWREVRGW